MHFSPSCVAFSSPTKKKKSELRTFFFEPFLFLLFLFCLFTLLPKNKWEKQNMSGASKNHLLFFARPIFFLKFIFADQSLLKQKKKIKSTEEREREKAWRTTKFFFFEVFPLFSKCHSLQCPCGAFCKHWSCFHDEDNPRPIQKKHKRWSVQPQHCSTRQFGVCVQMTFVYGGW